MGPSSLILIISSIWRPKIIELIETVEIMLISIISTVSIISNTSIIETVGVSSFCVFELRISITSVISKNLVAQKIELIEIRVSGFQLL